MKLKDIYLLISLILLLSACEDEITTNFVDDIPVVEAYLIPNSSIENIKLSKIIPYLEDTVGLEMIDDALVKIICEGLTYNLEHEIERPGYYYLADSNYKVSMEKEYELEFEYNNLLVKAKTVVPSAITGFSSSASVYSFVFEPGSGVPDPVVISWDNSSNDYYYLTIENITEDPEPLNENIDLDTDKKTIISPEIIDYFNIDFRQIKFYGYHRIVLFKINQEYVDMYETTSNSSQNLTEASTNIENGMGIFTSITSDTVFLTVSN